MKKQSFKNTNKMRDVLFKANSEKDKDIKILVMNGGKHYRTCRY